MQRLVIGRGEVLKRLDTMLEKAASTYAEVQPAMRNNILVFNPKTQQLEFSDQQAADQAYDATDQLILIAAARAEMANKTWDNVAQAAVAAVDSTAANEGIFSGRKINAEKELADLVLRLQTTATFDNDELPLDFSTLVANEALVLGSGIPVDFSIDD